MTGPATTATEQYPVDIFDDSLVWIAEYVDYESFTWVRRWRQPGEFTLRISRYERDGSDRDLQVGYFVSIYRGGAARIGRITSRSISLSDSGKQTEVWTISGVDAKGILTSRSTIAGISAGTGYDVQEGVAAETAIRHYIDRNVITPLDEAGSSDANRTISEFVLESVDGEKGGDVYYQARAQVLTDVIEDILLASTGIGYEVAFNRGDSEFEVQIKAGTDRSTSVIFSTDFGNIRAINYTESVKGAVTLAYVGGTGTANSRTIVTVPTSSDPTGQDRYETFIDGSTTDNSADQLEALGTAEIAAKGATETMTFEIMQDNSFTYMSRDVAGDFDLGDIITVIYTGIATLSGRIIEVTESYGSGTMGRITMTIGTEPPDFFKVIKSVNKRATTRGRA